MRVIIIAHQTGEYYDTHSIDFGALSRKIKHHDGVDESITHRLNKRQFLKLFTVILNATLMDLAERGYQESTIKSSEISSKIAPCSFHCTQNGDTLILLSI